MSAPRLTAAQLDGLAAVAANQAAPLPTPVRKALRHRGHLLAMYEYDSRGLRTWHGDAITTAGRAALAATGAK